MLKAVNQANTKAAANSTSNTAAQALTNKFSRHAFTYEKIWNQSSVHKSGKNV